MWIEVKIENDEVNEDIKVLKEFTLPVEPNGKRKIQYIYGLSISLMPKTELIWIKEGE